GLRHPATPPPPQPWLGFNRHRTSDLVETSTDNLSERTLKSRARGIIQRFFAPSNFKKNNYQG
ncbi:hypothetical protein, partial [Acidomonas methanolica]|uniref:hypothetical protein n=1 Tax=Acidomonas methanolica TaxID=437 RepID=UPI00222FBE21